ncbi:MAG: aminopeptidase P family protein, partial [Dialister invisus]|nr:aminopeptidase P family protein [Dialister invisus]
MTEKMKIIDFLRENQLDAIFVQKDENCRYLSKFTGSDSYLLLTKEELYLLTDSRYTEQARKEAADYIVVDYESHLAETVAKLVDEYHIKTMGMETVFSYQMYLSFYERMPDMEFKFCQIDQLRQIKSEEEISCIKEACRISDAGFKATLPFIRAGITEARL